MTQVLAIDSSSIVATIALLNENKLLAEYVVNNKKNHSEKIMVVLDRVLSDSGIILNDVDVVAVAKGPGSFTGIRIGMACAKGIAHGLKKPIIGINTLDGLAHNLMNTKSFICPVINAQRQEVYTSLYCWRKGELQRLWDYKLVKIDTLLDRLGDLKEKVRILGDGLPLLEKNMNNYNKKETKNISFVHQMFSMPRASSIAAMALCEYDKGNAEDIFSLKPFYIRKSSAEEKWEEHHGGKNQ